METKGGVGTTQTCKDWKLGLGKKEETEEIYQEQVVVVLEEGENEEDLLAV